MQIPVTDFPVDSAVDNGQALTTSTNNLAAAFMSTSLGPTAPPTATQGTLWIDTADPNTTYLKLMAPTGWISLISYDVASGALTYFFTAPVSSVNGKTGSVFVNEIYEATNTATIIRPLPSGAQVIFPDVAEASPADPGEIRKDTTPFLKVYDGANWNILGNYAVMADTLVAIGSAIALSPLLENNQTYFLHTATPITMDVMPLGNTNFPKPGSRLTLVGDVGTAAITIVGGTAPYNIKLKTGTEFILSANSFIELLVGSDYKLIEVSRGV